MRVWATVILGSMLQTSALASVAVRGVTPTGALLRPMSVVAVQRTGPGGRPLLAVSGAGLCRLYGRPVPRGSDDFQVVGATIYRGGALLYRVSEPLGSGLYLGDSGWLASVQPNPQDNKVGIQIYDHTGRLLFSDQVDVPLAFATGDSGRIFGVAGAKETLVFDGRTGSTRRLPGASRLAISAGGSLVALARGGRVEVWNSRGRVFVVKAPVDYIRGLSFSGSISSVYVLDRRRLLCYRLADGELDWEFRARAGEAFREIEVIGDTILVGVRQDVGSAWRGELLYLSKNGGLIRRTLSTETLAKRPAVPFPSTKDSPSRREFIVWPFQPFDQPVPLGNSYEEYQRYGGEPYLHPGVDMLVQPFTNVYAVADGYVKARLTISGAYHWRLAVADSATADTTEGWLYAHLIRESMVFDVGDTVHAGDLLGQIVPWPVRGFHHLHFVKVRQAGEEWTPDWTAAFNPLDVLRPLADSTAPVFEPVNDRGDFIAFVHAESGVVLDADSLTGRVDVIVRVGDHLGSDEWLCSVYELTYSLLALPSMRPVVGPVLAVRLSHPLPNYTGGAELTRVLYSDSGDFQSRGDYWERVFYHIITNSDGDTVLELSDADRALNCDSIRPGRYLFRVEARDASGNRSVVEDSVTIRPSMTPVARRSDSMRPVNLTLRATPNPFTERIMLRWTLPVHTRLTIEVFDVLGRLVMRSEQNCGEGRGLWIWDGRDLSGRNVPSGIYFCRLNAGERIQTLRLVKLR